MSAEDLAKYFELLNIGPEQRTAVIAAEYTLLSDLDGVEVQELLDAGIKPPVARKLLKNFANAEALLSVAAPVENGDGGGGGIGGGENRRNFANSVRAQ